MPGQLRLRPTSVENRSRRIRRSVEIPAPVSGWRRLLGDSLLVSGSTFVCQALATVTALALRWLLDPAQMGVWQGLKLFLNYANYANLGISKAATRELSQSLGRGDADNATHGLNLAYTFNIVTSALYALLLAAAGVWIGKSAGGVWSSAWSVGLLVVAALAILQRHVTFLVTILRAKQAFGATSRLALFEAALTLGVCCLAVRLWGLPGLYGGTALVMVASLWYLRGTDVGRLRWAWDAAEIRRLVGIGGPILLFGVVWSVFRSLDKLMILAYLPDREYQLGVYSLALMVTAQLYGLANMLSIVMGPRYAELFGRSGSRREVARLAARASELQAALLALLAGLGLVAAPPLLAALLPAYADGLSPLVCLVPGIVAAGLAIPLSQYLVAVDLQRQTLPVLFVGLALAAAGNHFALTLGYGLIGVACSTSIAYAVYFVLAAAVSIWRQLDGEERFRYVVAILLTLVPSLSVAMALEAVWASDSSDWFVAGTKTCAVLAIWGGTAAAGWRWGGWQAVWRQKA